MIYQAAWGTAVNVQSMVFGNMGETSGTGVAFYKRPMLPVKQNLYLVNILINAQGEDVVAGIRTPQPIDQDCRSRSSRMLMMNSMKIA